MYRGRFQNRIANSVTEYAIILVLISLVFMAMNTYIKRGFQGKIKELTDNFISKEQAGEADPTMIATSTAKSTADGSVTREILVGGGTRTTVSDKSIVDVTRNVITQVNPNTTPFTPADAGYVEPAQPQSK
ncbi:MAG: hypothetical protein V1925_05225 [Candidatus Omnitrophota bacterium]